MKELKQEIGVVYTLYDTDSSSMLLSGEVFWPLAVEAAKEFGDGLYIVYRNGRQYASITVTNGVMVVVHFLYQGD